LIDISEKDCAKLLSEEYNKLKDGDELINRIAIHCDDGVGRTGTLLAIINAISRLK